MDEGDNSHLRFTFRALQGVDLIYALDAGGPTTFAELLAIVALLFFSRRRRRGELGSFPPSPTGVPCIVSGYRLIGLRNMRREFSKELQSIKLPPSASLRRDGREPRRPW